MNSKESLGTLSQITNVINKFQRELKSVPKSHELKNTEYSNEQLPTFKNLGQNGTIFQQQMHQSLNANQSPSSKNHPLDHQNFDCRTQIHQNFSNVQNQQSGIHNQQSAVRYTNHSIQGQINTQYQSHNLPARNSSSSGFETIPQIERTNQEGQMQFNNHQKPSRMQNQLLQRLGFLEEKVLQYTKKEKLNLEKEKMMEKKLFQLATVVQDQFSELKEVKKTNQKMLRQMQSLTQIHVLYEQQLKQYKLKMLQIQKSFLRQPESSLNLSGNKSMSKRSSALSPRTSTRVGTQRFSTRPDLVRRY